jgi:N-methylhydantoinase B
MERPRGNTPIKGVGSKKSKKLDPVTLAVLIKRFEAVTTRMANTLLRTGRSGVLNVARDFSTSIVTRDCELLTGSESLPIHILSGADLMARSMMDLHPNLKRGDAFLHNSPYHGCSHPADHTILVPVIDDNEVHHFTVWVKAHQADIGNSQPTTYMGHARDVYEEGAGEREILSMAEEFGWETLHALTREWFDYSEKIMIAAIKKMPSGHATARSIHDPLPGTPPEGIRIKVAVEVDTENAVIEVDLRDNPDVMPCGLNLSESCARTAAMIGIFNQQYRGSGPHQRGQLPPHPGENPARLYRRGRKASHEHVRRDEPPG